MSYVTKEDLAFFEKNGFVFNKVIGRGGFGIIFLVHSDKYAQDFAIKRISVTNFNKSEIDCIISVDFHWVVNLYEYFYFMNSVYLLMEYCPNNLYNITKDNPLDGDELLKYAIGIVRAVKACHDNKISHSDIKPANFLIDAYGRIKICDFGFSKAINDDLKSNLFGGSTPFMAPEVLKMIPYDSMKADIWSVGVTLYYIAAGRLPWFGKTKEIIIDQIKEGKISTRYIKDKSIIDVIAVCLNQNPEFRPTANELINLPYFNTNPTFNESKRTQTLTAIMSPPLKPKLKVKRASSICKPIPAKNKILRGKRPYPSIMRSTSSISYFNH